MSLSCVNGYTIRLQNYSAMDIGQKFCTVKIIPMDAVTVDVLPIVTMEPAMLCFYSKCHSAKFRTDKCRYAKCHYIEYRYVDCR